MPIRFFSEEISFNFKGKRKHSIWLSTLTENEGFSVGDINYIFCTDEYLYKINVEYLNHETYTDIITFDQSDAKEEVSGDIYISIERVIDNAKLNHTTFENELRRVISHGILHLMGYKDKSVKDRNLMRKKEDFAIQMFQTMK